MAAESPRSSHAHDSESEYGPAKPATLALAFTYLSPSSREALARANGFRLERGGDRIHMEHLLTGLLMKEGGPAEHLFQQCDVTREDVIARLRDAEKDVPEPATGRTPRFGFRVTTAPVDASTPLSQHVGAAVTAALKAVLDRSASSSREPRLQSRDLLLGMGTVEQCSVVRAFQDVFARAPGIVASLGARAASSTAPSNPVASAGKRLDSVEANLGEGGGATNDRPEQAEDRLGFTQYVNAFADLIESPDTAPPITIGIYGSWGAGKSFLLWHLQEELRRRARQRRYPFLAALEKLPLRHAPRLALFQLRRRVPAAAARVARWMVEPPTHAFRRWMARWNGSSAPARTRERVPHHVYAVTFNAWEYSATERVWPRLVRAVLQHVEGDVRWYTRPFLFLERGWRKLRYNFPRTLRAHWPSLIAWIAVGALLGGALATIPDDKLPDALEQLLDLTIGKQFVLPAALAALATAVKLFKETFLVPLGGWMSALLDDGVSYGSQIDYMAAIKADLDLLERRLARAHARVLILIDDLDRCEPDKMIQVLQAVNLLLDRGSFVVCLGLDARVVTAAVDKHYEGLLVRAGVSGYEYLDKIIQIPFRIPDPSREQLEHLLAKQLGAEARASDDARARIERAILERDLFGSTTVDEPIVSTEGDADTRALLEAATAAAGDAGAGQAGRPPSERNAATPRSLYVPDFGRRPLRFSDDERRAFTSVAPHLRPNPRHIKRLVNVYALVRSLSVSRGDLGRIGGPESTVRWLVLAAQWPYAVRQMLVRLDALLRETPAPNDGSSWRPANAVSDDAALPALLAGASLDRNRRRRFDWDDARLAALLADSHAVTWDQLRHLRRYTLNFNPALDAELQATAADTPRDPRTNRALREEIARGQRAREAVQATQGTTPQGPLPAPPPSATRARPS